eukprot:COSAG06_NODE_5352_length_3531_cov_95.618007_3_plen_79_part_00
MNNGGSIGAPHQLRLLPPVVARHHCPAPRSRCRSDSRAVPLVEPVGVLSLSRVILGLPLLGSGCFLPPLQLTAQNQPN